MTPMTAAAKLRAAWGVSIFAILLAYVAVVVPERREIEQVQQRARNLYDVANRNERIVAETPMVEAERRNVEGEIESLVGALGAAPISLTLATLERENRRFGVRVISVSPGVAVAPPARNRDAHDPLHVQDLALEVQGKFGDIVQVIGDLSRDEALIGVRSVALDVARGAEQGSPELQASLTASVYTLDPNWKEDADASRSLR